MKTPVCSDDMLLNRMLLLAALAIVMMGIHLAASILSIILISLFLAIVLEPVVALLCRTRLPRSLIVESSGCFARSPLACRPCAAALTV